MDEFGHILRMIELIDYMRLLSKGVSISIIKIFILSKFQEHDTLIPHATTPHWFKRFCLRYPLQLYTTLYRLSSSSTLFSYTDTLQYYRVFSPPCYGCTRYPRCCRPRSVPLIMCSSSHLQYPRSRDDSGFGRPATCSLAAIAQTARGIIKQPAYGGVISRKLSAKGRVVQRDEI